MSALAKGAAVAFTAGTLATGAAVLHLPRLASGNSGAAATGAQHAGPAGRRDGELARIDSALAPAPSRREGAVGSGGGGRLNSNFGAREDGHRAGATGKRESPRFGARTPNRPRGAPLPGADLGAQGGDRAGARHSGGEDATGGGGDGRASASPDHPAREDSGGDSGHSSAANSAAPAPQPGSLDRSGDGSRGTSAGEGQQGQLVAADGTRRGDARFGGVETLTASLGRGG
jgi:hypothetical protein